MNNLYTTKTFWTGIVGIAAAIGAYATGEIETGAALQTIISGLLGIFIRSPYPDSESPEDKGIRFEPTEETKNELFGNSE